MFLLFDNTTGMTHLKTVVYIRHIEERNLLPHNTMQEK